MSTQPTGQNSQLGVTSVELCQATPAEDQALSFSFLSAALFSLVAHLCTTPWLEFPKDFRLEQSRGLGH